MPIIREQDPLKQGLKPLILRRTAAAVTIREQDPLKQGLKQTTIKGEVVHQNLFVSKIH